MKVTLLLLIALCLAVSISARSNSLLQLVKTWQPEEEAKGLRKEFGLKCTALTCAKSNKECGNLDMGNDAHVTGCYNYYEESCNVTESGVGYSSGTCLSTLPAGAVCDIENDRCSAGTTCRFTQFVPGGDDLYHCYNNAKTNSSALPGQICGAFITCSLFGDTAECVNGVCKFVPNGQPCVTSTGQCNYESSYCDLTATSPVCKPLLEQYAACNSSLSNQCQRDLICNPTSILNDQAQCVERFSIKEGKPCKQTDACKDGYCENRLHEDHFSGVCKDFRKTSTIGEKCAESSDCTQSNGEFCSCNLDGESKCTNFYFEREYVKRITEDDDCEEEVRNKCATSLNGVEYNKCVYDSCKKTACQLYKDTKKHLGFPYSGQTGCMFVQMCDAAGLFASLPLLAIAAVIVMIFQ